LIVDSFSHPLFISFNPENPAVTRRHSIHTASGSIIAAIIAALVAPRWRWAAVTTLLEKITIIEPLGVHGAGRKLQFKAKLESGVSQFS